MTGTYLRMLGWDTSVDLSHDKPVRKELMNQLRTVLAGCPRTPMPHGKIRRNLFNLIPEAFHIQGDWRDRLDCSIKWSVVPEDPTEPVMTLGVTRPLPRTYPRADLFVLSMEQLGVLVFDHEETGPWWLDLRLGRLPVASCNEKVYTNRVISGEPVEPIVARRAKAWVRRKLREKWFYIPNYRLATRGPSTDHLWNYFPVNCDVSVASGSFVIETFQGAESILAWTDYTSGACLVETNDVELILKIPNAYYLEWPRCRWLLAVPGPFIHEGLESPVEPSFVVW